RQSVLPFDHLARVRAEAPENRRHRAESTIFALIDRIPRPDAGEQVVVLDLVRIARLPLELPLVAAGLHGTCADVGVTARSLHVLGDTLPAVLDVPALAEHPRAVGVLELDEMVIVDFAVLLADADLSPSLALGANGMRALQPVDDVEVMDVLLADV